jgi:hypothetical protein
MTTSDGADAVNYLLDRLVRPEIRMRRRTCSAFQLCGHVGLVLAVTLAMALVAHRGLSPWVMIVVVLGAVGSFFGLAMLTKVVTGKEDLVYYRHEIAVIAVATGLLWLLHQPILAYLDGTVLGVGLFLACGRIGCLMVGCCHGRPHPFGVRYRVEHAEAGFPACLVGVRLFPIQLVESLYVFAIVGLGSALAWTGEWPGAGLGAYVTAYAVGRFAFEFWRGDRERPYVAGFSEAQWSSFVLLTTVAVAERAGALPEESWHAVTLVGVALAAITVAATRVGRRAEGDLLHPRHVLEIAEALDRAASRPAVEDRIAVRRTSLGIRISASAVDTEQGRVFHYSLSGEHGLTERGARSLAGLIARLKHPLDTTELLPGNLGVYHVLMRPTL